MQVAWAELSSFERRTLRDFVSCVLLLSSQVSALLKLSQVLGSRHRSHTDLHKTIHFSSSFAWYVHDCQRLLGNLVSTIWYHELLVQNSGKIIAFLSNKNMTNDSLLPILLPLGPTASSVLVPGQRPAVQPTGFRSWVNRAPRVLLWMRKSSKQKK